MSAAIEFKCPHCARVTRVPGHLAGKQGPCPGCKKVIEVPRPRPKAEAEPAPRKKAEEKAEEAATGTVSAPAADGEPAPSKNDPLAILRQLPGGLVAGLFLAVLFPIAGLAVCIYYSSRSPKDSLAKRWGQIGMRLSAAAMVISFLVIRHVNSLRLQREQQQQQQRRTVQPRSSPPGKTG